MIQLRRDSLDAELRRILPPDSSFAWELGCGHGHFLTAYAQAHPNKICIGIDIISERIERALRKRDRAKLGNLFFVHAEARLFLEVLPISVSFSELFVLFPDPWPKVRHHKHRILQTEFLSLAALRTTSDTGRICFRTDYGPYFENAQRSVRMHPDWRLSEEEWPFEFSTVFQNRAATYQSLVARHTHLGHRS